MADLVEEVADHLGAVLRVVHLWVELNPIKPSGRVSDGGGGAHVGVGGQGKPLRHLGHVVPMAHPGDALCRQPLEEGEAGVVLGGCLAVLPGGVLLGGGDQPAQAVGHQLAAIADAQNGDAPGENVRIHVGRSVQVYAVGPPGKNDTDGIQGFQLCQRCGVGFDFAVNPALPDPPGDELVVLSAKIQDQDKFMLHGETTFFSCFL